jgi:hypothetical protein
MATLANSASVSTEPFRVQQQEDQTMPADLVATKSGPNDAPTTMLLHAEPAPDHTIPWPRGFMEQTRDQPSSFIEADEESDVASEAGDDHVGIRLQRNTGDTSAPRRASGAAGLDEHSIRSEAPMEFGVDNTSPHGGTGNYLPTLTQLRNMVDSLSVSQMQALHATRITHPLSITDNSSLHLSTLAMSLPIVVGEHGVPRDASDGVGKKSSGNAPVKTRNVYVAALPLDFTEQDLANLLKPYGNVKSCRMFSETDRVAEIGRAYGFALFEGAGSAEAAVEHLDGTPLGQSRIQVRLSRNGVVKKPKDWRERAKQKSQSSSATPVNNLSQSGIGQSGTSATPCGSINTATPAAAVSFNSFIQAPPAPASTPFGVPPGYPGAMLPPHPSVMLRGQPTTQGQHQPQQQQQPAQVNLPQYPMMGAVPYPQPNPYAAYGFAAAAAAPCPPQFFMSQYPAGYYPAPPNAMGLPPSQPTSMAGGYAPQGAYAPQQVFYVMMQPGQPGPTLPPSLPQVQQPHAPSTASR